MSFVGEKLNNETEKKIFRKAVEVLYANGFSDDNKDFWPVIVGINFQFFVEDEKRSITLGFRANSNWKILKCIA